MARRGVTRWATPVLVLLALSAAACTTDGTDAPSATATATAAATATSGEVAAPAPSTERASETTDNSSEVTTSVAAPVSTDTASTETIATVPEEGVPGIDSGDPFCRGWGEFAGSFQALALASSLGADAVAATRLEVVASPAVVSAAQQLADGFPESIEVERDTFVDDVIGPFARRAARAVDELRAAGLASAELEQLGDEWLEALVDAGVDDPEIVVAVPSELVGAVDAATTAFFASVPTIALDPSLVTQASAPATRAYLSENCPDQGILGGNDAID